MEFSMDCSSEEVITRPEFQVDEGLECMDKGEKSANTEENGSKGINLSILAKSNN